MAFLIQYDSGTIKAEGIRFIRPAEKEDIELALVGNITDPLQVEKGKSQTGKSQLDFIYVLYKKIGNRFIERLDGYFLIFIKDNGRLKVFNNRYSSVSCYYLKQGKNCYFSDSYSLILKNLKNREVNFDVINLFLNSGYSYSEKMPFKNTYRMIPAHYLEVDETSKTRLERYSGMVFRRASRPVNELLDEYESLWQEAIYSFAKANNSKKIGSALSGGLDTSWVVLMASKAMKQEIQTYTCYYDYSLFNELKESEFVSNRTGAKHHKLKVSETDLDLIPEMINAAEEPVLSSSLSLFMAINEAASNNVDVFLTGDGGNNIYHHLYPVGEIHKYIRYLPYGIRKLLFFLVDASAKLTNNERLNEARYPMHAFSYRNFYDNFYKNLTCYRHFDPSQRKMLFKKGCYEEFDERNMAGRIPITKDDFDNKLIESRFVYGNMQYVSAFQEKFAKENGILLFPPYQNRKIMDFLSSLPFSMMFRGSTLNKLTNTANKMYFQKQALKRHFPKSFVDKTGQPFDQPFHSWFERRPRLVELLFGSLKKRGWYNEGYLDFLLNEHKAQHQHEKIFCQLSNHAYRIMALLSLEVWARIYIDGFHLKKGEPIEEFIKR